MPDNTKDSVDLSFDILQKEYESEESRNKYLETKSQIMLALCGIIISANMILLKSIFDQNYFLKTKLILISVELFLIAYAMYELLSVFKIRLFKKIDHISLSSIEIYQSDERELKKKLIFDYNECINESFEILGKKARSVKYGVNLIEFSILLFCIIIFIVVISTYKDRSQTMSKNQNTTQSTTNSQNSSIKPSTTHKTPITESSNNSEGSNKSGGLGTITVERSHKK